MWIATVDSLWTQKHCIVHNTVVIVFALWTVLWHLEGRSLLFFWLRIAVVGVAFSAKSCWVN